MEGLRDGVWKVYVYDIFNRLVAEYGGLQSTDDGGVKYVMIDRQGSSRMLMSNSGYVRGRIDYSGYGEEIGAGVGQRVVEQGYNGLTSLRQRYGMTERDEGSGLEHTWWRKLEVKAGRWTSPDPYDGSIDASDPQSFNRYSYVENDPVNFVDPSGLVCTRACVQVLGVDSGPDCSTVCTSDERVILLYSFMLFSKSFYMSLLKIGLPTYRVRRNVDDDEDSVELSDCIKNLLQKFFPKVNLSEVRLVYTPSIDGLKTTSNKPVKAITIGTTIYVPNRSIFDGMRYGATWQGLADLIHELIHVDQFRRLGKPLFGVAYGLEALFEAMIVPAPEALAATYENNEFETRAKRYTQLIIDKLQYVEKASLCPIDVGEIATVTISG